MLIVSAGRDMMASNAAIKDYASLLRRGSHLVGGSAKHELLMERDRFRSQFWAAFEAFVAGTPVSRPAGLLKSEYQPKRRYQNGRQQRNHERGDETDAEHAFAKWFGPGGVAAAPK
jgi:hypothetical protein